MLGRAFLLDKFGATSYEIWCYIVLNLVLERPVLVLGNLVLDQKFFVLIVPLPFIDPIFVRQRYKFFSPIDLVRKRRNLVRKRDLPIRRVN